MPKTRRSYTEAFKREAVRLYEQSGKTQEDIEEELGIGSGCLSRWKKRYGADADTVKLQEQAAQATQIRRLHSSIDYHSPEAYEQLYYEEQFA
jgi:transposase